MGNSFSFCCCGISDPEVAAPQSFELINRQPPPPPPPPQPLQPPRPVPVYNDCTDLNIPPPYQLQDSSMAIALGRRAADEEAQAEVEVLNSKVDRTSALSKKIKASLTKLETSGQSVQEAMGPIHSNVNKLQVLGKSWYIHLTFKFFTDGSTDISLVIGAIDHVKQPSDIRSNEEDIIRAGYAPDPLQMHNKAN